VCTTLSAGGLYCQIGLLYTFNYFSIIIIVIVYGSSVRIQKADWVGQGRRTCDQKELIVLIMCGRAFLIPGFTSFSLSYFTLLFFSFSCLFGKFCCLDTPCASSHLDLAFSDSHDSRGDCRIFDVI
jgi:hypothetical protein